MFSLGFDSLSISDSSFDDPVLFTSFRLFGKKKKKTWLTFVTKTSNYCGSFNIEFKVGISTPWEAVSTEGISFFCPRDIEVVDVQKCSDLEMGPHPPRVRRNWPPFVGL